MRELQLAEKILWKNISYAFMEHLERGRAFLRQDITVLGLG